MSKKASESPGGKWVTIRRITEKDYFLREGTVLDSRAINMQLDQSASHAFEVIDYEKKAVRDEIVAASIEYMKANQEQLQAGLNGNRNAQIEAVCKLAKHEKKLKESINRLGN